MKNRLFTLIVGFFALLVLAATAAAQTVQGPTAPLVLESPLGVPNEGGQAEVWNFTYGASYLPTGQTLGNPFLTSVRITVTPVTGSPVVTTVQRAQITRETTTAACAPRTAPCLLLPPVPVSVGDSQITAEWITAEGQVGGASTAVPFTGLRPTPPVAAVSVRSSTP